MINVKIKILRDGVWKELLLKNDKTIKYNAVINRIGKITSREISHTNTFSLPYSQQNIEALGINRYNPTQLAKTFNKKFEAKYYVEERLIQKGFIVINNTNEKGININFIDESLAILDQWGATTYFDLLNSQLFINKFPDDYYYWTEFLYEKTLGGTFDFPPNLPTKDYGLVSFPNNLNAIGDKFQQDNNNTRLGDKLFNPYQSRPLFNVLGFLDVICKLYDYTPIYTNSVEIESLKKKFFVNKDLGKNQANADDLRQYPRPFSANINNLYDISYIVGPGDYRGTNSFTYAIDEDFGWKLDVKNLSDLSLVPNIEQQLGFPIPSEKRGDIYSPVLENLTDGSLVWDFDVDLGIYTTFNSSKIKIYSLWWRESDLNMLAATVNNVVINSSNDHYNIQAQAIDINNYTGSDRVFWGVVCICSPDRTSSDISLSLTNMRLTEVRYPKNIVKYNEDDLQIIPDEFNLFYAAPKITIKKLLSAVLQQQGLLINIDNKNKNIEFFTYDYYKTQKENNNYDNWSKYFQKYIQPIFNTDYGTEYAKKNEIGLSSPFSGNSSIVQMYNQGTDSKYKESTQNFVKDLKDVSKIDAVDNDGVTYFEYTNLGLGLVEKGTPITQFRRCLSDRTYLGNIASLDTFQNVNYSVVPKGITEWYDVVDSSIRVEATFLLPIDIIKNLNLNRPIYVDYLGGFFIIEEISEYVNSSTPVKVKLIKLNT